MQQGSAITMLYEGGSRPGTERQLKVLSWICEPISFLVECLYDPIPEGESHHPQKKYVTRKVRSITFAA